MRRTYKDQARGDLDSFPSAQHLTGYFWKAFAMIAVAHVNTGTLILKEMFDSME